MAWTDSWHESVHAILRCEEEAIQAAHVSLSSVRPLVWWTGKESDKDLNQMRRWTRVNVQSEHPHFLKICFLTFKMIAGLQIVDWVVPRFFGAEGWRQTKISTRNSSNTNQKLREWCVKCQSNITRIVSIYYSNYNNCTLYSRLWSI